jgi:transposase-like protein
MAGALGSDGVRTACGGQTSVTAGTIFEGTRKPLVAWFRAIWWVTSQKNGASALGLKRVLGVGSYETAWTWIHKMRRAMVRPGRDRLSGIVAVDESYVGGLEEGTHGRATETKALVAIAAESKGKAIGRIRMIRDASADSLVPFIERSIEPGSVARTDGWPGYSGLNARGYRHEVIVIKNRKNASELLPHTHRVVSLLQRWLLGTHQGAVSREHLDDYLDEFTFRFNRRTSRHRGKLFYRLIEQAVQVDPVPYDNIIRHARGLRRRPQRVVAP